MGTIFQIGSGLFVIVILIWMIGYTFELHQIDEVIEEVSQDCMDEYCGREGQDDGCEEVFATTKETGCDDNKQDD